MNPYLFENIQILGFRLWFMVYGIVHKNAKNLRDQLTFLGLIVTLSGIILRKIIRGGGG